jgi:hypothetical protein
MIQQACWADVFAGHWQRPARDTYMVFLRSCLPVRNDRGSRGRRGWIFRENTAFVKPGVVLYKTAIGHPWWWQVGFWATGNSHNEITGMGKVAKCINASSNPVMLDILTVTLQIKKTHGISSGSLHFLRFRDSYSFAQEALCIGCLNTHTGPKSVDSPYSRFKQGNLYLSLAPRPI